MILKILFTPEFLKEREIIDFFEEKLEKEN
jgi:hypothetical protein